jgi:hypothetical protein
MTDKSHKIHCWCGQVHYPKTLHYPGNDPEYGPAHYPKLPCPECGQEPHKGPCFPNCTCESPSPFNQIAREDGEVLDSFMVCKNCGLDIYFPDQPEEGIIEGDEIHQMDLDTTAFAKASAETFKDGMQFIQSRKPGVPIVKDNEDGTIDIEIPGGSEAFIEECKRQEAEALEGLEWLAKNFGSVLTPQDHKDLKTFIHKKRGH